MHVLQTSKNVKEAIDFPRLHNQLQPNYTQYEENWPMEYIHELEGKGHEFKSIPHLTVVTAVQKQNGQVYANSDYRKGTESEPAGY